MPAPVDDKLTVLIDALVSKVFQNRIYMIGLMNKCGYFALRPNQRGVYRITAEYENCLEKFNDLLNCSELYHTTVKHAYQFMRTCMRVKFVLEKDVTAFPVADEHMLRTYCTETSVCIQLIIVDSSNRKQFASIALVASLDRLKEEGDKMKRKMIQEQARNVTLMKVLARGPPPEVPLSNLAEEDNERFEAKFATAVLEHLPRICMVCRAVTGKKCSGCKLRYYCSQSCQRTDWPLHRAECTALNEYGQYLSGVISGEFAVNI